MNETGKVIKTEKGNATIRFERKSECAKCGMCAFKKDSAQFDITVKNTLNAKEGDYAEVSIAGGYVLLSSIIVYLVPLFTTAIGLIAGFFIGGQDLALLLSLVFLAIGFLLVILIDKVMKKRSKNLLPVLVSIVKEENEIKN